MSDIDLLLAAWDTGSPVLEDGLSMDAAANGTRPKTKPAGPSSYLDYSGDPNDLEAQGWGLVVPDDDAIGDRLLAAIDPLVKERERQQGTKAPVFKVPKNMSTEQTWSWMADEFCKRPVEERPRYLLLLGGPELVSWDFQAVLAADLFVGRLALSQDEHYRIYADKVLASERASPADGSRALYFTVRDGTAATTAGHAGLVLPSLAAAQRQAAAGKLRAKEVRLLGEDGGSVSPEDFLAAAAPRIPTLMFSVSHGLAAPRRGWASLEEQHRFQGTMSFGAGQRLTHEDVASRPFLPGGAWFYFACLGAGTPSESEYRHWLVKLREINLYGGSPDDVLRSLPKSDEPPFAAALPQAALANPDGPLSILGHVDLAWTFSFQKYALGKDNRVETRNVSRFDNVFQALVGGKRMGAGYTQLSRIFNEANARLTGMFNQEAKTADQGLAPADDPARRVDKATLWMERQDIAAYVLLGDPAARLNVKS